jgi:hypothetical protein
MPAAHDPLPFHADHIVARNRGRTTSTNLAYACFYCNARKGTNLAGIDRRTRAIVRLFNPRTDRWEQHFRWFGARLVGLTAVGRATVDVLTINHPDNVAARAHLMAEGLFEQIA